MNINQKTIRSISNVSIYNRETKDYVWPQEMHEYSFDITPLSSTEKASLDYCSNQNCYTSASYLFCFEVQNDEDILYEQFVLLPDQGDFNYSFTKNTIVHNEFVGVRLLRSLNSLQNFSFIGINSFTHSQDYMSEENIQVFSRAFNNFPNVTIIRCINDNFGEESSSLPAFVNILPPTITSLTLNGAQLSVCGALLLAQNFPNLPNLTSLDLSCNMILDEGAIHLFKKIGKCTNITELNLNNNFIGLAALKMASDLKELTNLRVIRLAGNKLGPNEIHSLSGFFSSQKSLVTIDLASNNISNGISALFSLSSWSVENLDLCDNKIAEADVKQLVEITKTCPRSIILDLEMNNVSEEGKNEIQNLVSGIENISIRI